MRSRVGVTRMFAWMGLLVGMSGCASLDAHRRLEAQNRGLSADKVALQQELADERNAGTQLRGQLTTLQRELDAKSELVTNLRNENNLLDDYRKMVLGQMEGLSKNQRLGDVIIEGVAALPEPLDSALKQFADQHPGIVEFDSRRGIVKWKADLLFDLGSDVVKTSSTEPLRGFCDILKSPAAADFEVIVVGHTDNRPISRPQTKDKHPTNWHLSAHRSISVGQALRQCGYPPQQIGLMGYGEFRPMADNRSEQGQSQNRRVDIYLVPLGSIAQATASAVQPPSAKGPGPVER